MADKPINIPAAPDAKAGNYRLVDQALEMPAVRSLYDSVAATTPIEFTLKERGTWSSSTVAGRTKIEVAPTARPAAALAHELLHAKLKIDGYRQHLVFYSMDDDQSLLKDVGQAIDNELQHHRFYADFIAMGFPPKDFYHDDDGNAFSHVRKELRKLDASSSPAAFFLNFLTAISPGGGDSPEARQRLIDFLADRSGAETLSRLEKIRAEFDQWKKAEPLDPGPWIARIMGHLGQFDRTWVGIVDTDFPKGHFVGAPFNADELVAWHRARNEKQRR